jgi:hypothetical protein
MATIDVVDLLMSFREVTLWFFELFLLIDPFGHLEHLISKTLELVVVSGLVHSLGVKNADAILAAFKFTWLGLVLLVVSRPLHHVDGTDLFSLLVVALG